MTPDDALVNRPRPASLIPPFEEWRGVLARDRELLETHTITLSGVLFGDLRRRARDEFREIAAQTAYRHGFPAAPAGSDEPLVLTGHQPELYHCGVWCKVFAASRLAAGVNGSAYEAVVDTDWSSSLSLHAMSAVGGASAVDIPLSLLEESQPFFRAQVPDPDALSTFGVAAEQALATLPDGEPLGHFMRFRESLGLSSASARDLADLVVSARRRIELEHGMDVRSAPVSDIAGCPAYHTFVAHVLLEWERFAACYNRALAGFRTRHRTRSSAQPFPDLIERDGLWDTVFWMIREGRRVPLRVDVRGDEALQLVTSDGVAVECRRDLQSVMDALSSCGAVIAPKAVTLTLYLRAFVADAFIHGTGGGRYDEVTDDLMRDFLGLEPPRSLVATMDLHLSSGVSAKASDPAAARARLNRFMQNPDEYAGEASMLEAADRADLERAVGEKRDVLSAIASEGSDRKALGIRIKELNALIAVVLTPVREILERELADAEAEEAQRAVLEDRTYSWCLFDPGEVDRTVFGGR